ncbi:phage virion morphogenesis protein, partial [Acetobacter sp. DsW_063]|uniref:phage virion morphogenesis protein n=1 Tax=Acetobacter sp. DsW_063 TaxID=1514894 RepID=UPI000A3A74EE
IQAALGRVAAIGRDPSGVLGALGVAVVRNTQRRMERGVDPRGVLWWSYAPLNPLYRSTKEGPSILIGRGGFRDGLAASIVSQVRGNTLVWGSKKEYARIHQLGGWIFPRTAPALTFSMGGLRFHVQSVFIPERPYLGFTSEDRDALLGELEEYLARAMRG